MEVFAHEQTIDQHRTPYYDGDIWSPLMLNAFHENGSVREDFAFEYGTQELLGSFYHCQGFLGFDQLTQQWKQINDFEQDKYKISLPFNIYDKIKVVSCMMVYENIFKGLLDTGSIGVQNKSKNSKSDVFLQAVTKCDNPLATIARYKVKTTSCQKHALYPFFTDACALNINMPRGIEELGVILATMQASLCLNNPSGGRVNFYMVYPQQKNNSITVDSFISCVQNELTFKKKAMKSSKFKLLSKGRFPTHKYITTYQNSNFKQCQCKKCNKQYNTFHRKKITNAKYCTTYFSEDFFKEALSPLKSINELQVHERCFNCSAVSGPTLLPVIAKMGTELLSDTKTASVDLALVRVCNMLETKSHGLIPSHISNLCEILCWQLRTRFMTRDKQIEIAKNTIEPMFKNVRLSRQNFAQSGGWCQSLVRGQQLITLPDQALVSHKYKNYKTIELFGMLKQKSVRHSGVKRKCGFENDLYVPFCKRIKRRRGPVHFFFYGPLRFAKNMSKWGLDKPSLKEF